LCESLEDLQNVNGLLRNEGQSMWSMLGNILGQVRFVSAPHLP
ncbi:PHD finger protein 14 isoform X1, partial [Tachysurus ichikawai]